MNNQKILCGLSKALWDSDLVATRVILSLAEFFWAVMLLWAGDTFGRPTYTVMSYVMSEEAWGLVLLISSVTQMTIAIGEYFHEGWARCFAAWNAVLWGFLCISMVLSVSPPPAATGGEFALAFAACWVWIRPYILYGYYRKAYGDE
jgi:hypothetical protein